MRVKSGSGGRQRSSAVSRRMPGAPRRSSLALFRLTPALARSRRPSVKIRAAGLQSRDEGRTGSKGHRINCEIRNHAEVCMQEGGTGRKVA